MPRSHFHKRWVGARQGRQAGGVFLEKVQASFQVDLKNSGPHCVQCSSVDNSKTAQHHLSTLLHLPHPNPSACLHHLPTRDFLLSPAAVGSVVLSLPGRLHETRTP